MSGAIARVVDSMPTQSNARCWLTHTSDVAARKPARQPANHRPPRGLSWRRNPTAYATTAANRTLTSVSTMRPSESTASHPFSAVAWGACHSTPTITRCAALTAPSTARRAPGRSSANARPTPLTSTMRSRRISTPPRRESRFLQLHEIRRRDGVELAVDVKDDDSHDEHGDEHVEQHADLDEKRDPVHEC